MKKSDNGESRGRVTVMASGEGGMAAPVEALAAGTITEQPIGEVECGGELWPVWPPTVGTMIMIAGEASRLPEAPELRKGMSDGEVVSALLRAAEGSGALGRIGAIILLGAKRMRERPVRLIGERIRVRRRWRWLKPWRWGRGGGWGWRMVETPRLEADWLGEKLLEELRAGELRQLIEGALSEGGLESFFALTTSLRGARGVLAATAEVEREG